MSVDLNLLTVADALLETASVTETADLVNLSQPAVSRALSRLRSQLGDPLLVREGRHMVPTPYAESLRPRLRHALLELQRTLGETDRFDPKEASTTLTVAASDFASIAFLPRALGRLVEEAPRVRLVMLPEAEPFEPLLESGECDLAAGPYPSNKSWIESAQLFRSGWSCVSRPGHPWLDEPGLDAYCAARHVMVSPSGQGLGPADFALRELKRSRHIVVRIHDFVGALAVAAQSDLLLTLPTRLAEAARPLMHIDWAPVPFPMPDAEVTMSWHAARTDDPRLRWLRELVRYAVDGARAPEPGAEAPEPWRPRPP